MNTLFTIYKTILTEIQALQMHHDAAIILRFCQRIIEAPDLCYEDKERLFTHLDNHIFDVGNDIINTVLYWLKYRGLHDALLTSRATYEHEREVHLAKAIIEKGDLSPLEKFRSTSWYKQAHDFENDILAQFSPKKLMIVGSGPFPTTALSLMDAYQVTAVERDEEACILSRKAAQIHGKHLQVLHQDALDISDFSDYDCVIVGTIVGVLDVEKKLVIDHFLRSVPASTTLIFRTAIGPGRIIYPTIDTNLFGKEKYHVMVDPPQKTFTMVLVERERIC